MQLILTLAVLLAVAPLPAQTRVASTAEAAELPMSNIRVDVNVVNLLCTVRNWTGAFVKDLSKNNFTIFENGRPQAIRYFAREVDTPLTVALMLDVSGSVTPVLEKEKDAASRFAAEVLRPSDRSLLVTFSHTIAMTDLTPKVDVMLADLKRARQFQYNLPPEFAAHGGTLLYESVKRVCDERLAGLSGRKAIVVVTDGVDNGSTVGEADAVRAAQRADTVIYAIHYSGDATGRPEGKFALDRLAAPTGGRSFNTGVGRTLSAVFATITEEMRSQYSIGYVSDNQLRDGGYRRLKVKLDRPGLRIQARQGYYAAR